ncbi:hypothetical protein [Psychroserpens jangbogonensis]|nr:hypothetical protein [Psychroserpens jangbogonensis]
MPCCAAVGFAAGNASTLGINIPSSFEGVAWFEAVISNAACGLVLPTPT